MRSKRAEDFKADGNGYEILTGPETFETVHKEIEAKGIRCDVAEITPLPSLTVPVADEDKLEPINQLMEALEENDDVKEVYCNAEFSG
ncbi:MAG: YebC/PmpR family DNA-binding transcriptional regulator [Verrucomicrobiota bacterium]